MGGGFVLSADSAQVLLLLLWSFVTGLFLGAVYELFRFRRTASLGTGALRKMLGLPADRAAAEGKIQNDGSKEKSGSAGNHTGNADGKKKQKHFAAARQRVFSAADAVWIFIEDILFSLIAAAAVIVLLYNVSSGRVRVSALIGLPAGFFLWYFTVGKAVRRLSAAAVLGVRSAAAAAVRVAASAFRAFFRTMFSAFRRITEKPRRALITARLIKGSEIEQKRFLRSALPARRGAVSAALCRPETEVRIKKDKMSKNKSGLWDRG